MLINFEDSINAGNCEKGTISFAKKFFPKNIAQNIPITARQMLEKQDNSYTRAIIKNILQKKQK